jgi:hypothetical protein
MEGLPSDLEADRAMARGSARKITMLVGEAVDHQTDMLDDE